MTRHACEHPHCTVLADIGDNQDIRSSHKCSICGATIRASDELCLVPYIPYRQQSSVELTGQYHNHAYSHRACVPDALQAYSLRRLLQ